MINKASFPVMGIEKIQNQGNWVVILASNEFVDYPTSKEWAKSIHPNATPSHEACFISNHRADTVVEGRRYDEIDWEPIQEGVNYVETREMVYFVKLS